MQQQASRFELNAHPAGQLVEVAPGAQYPRIPRGRGVIVDHFGAPNVLVWFWHLGDPAPGETVHAIFPSELRPTEDELGTMERAELEAMARQVGAAMEAGTIVMSTALAALSSALLEALHPDA